jgi:uncharacterized protein YndB with AHSA1/START domain
VRIEVTTCIDASPRDVFAVVSDYTAAPRWQRATKSARWLTEPPVRVGTRHEQTTRFMGRDMSASYEVVALDPGRSIAIRSIDAPFPMTVTRTVEPDGNGTRVTEVSEGGPTGFRPGARPVDGTGGTACDRARLRTAASAARAVNRGESCRRAAVTRRACR